VGRGGADGVGSWDGLFVGSFRRYLFLEVCMKNKIPITKATKMANTRRTISGMFIPLHPLPLRKSEKVRKDSAAVNLPYTISMEWSYESFKRGDCNPDAWKQFPVLEFFF